MHWHICPDSIWRQQIETEPQNTKTIQFHVGCVFKTLLLKLQGEFHIIMIVGSVVRRTSIRNMLTRETQKKKFNYTLKSITLNVLLAACDYLTKQMTFLQLLLSWRKSYCGI